MPGTKKKSGKSGQREHYKTAEKKVGLRNPAVRGKNPQILFFKCFRPLQTQSRRPPELQGCHRGCRYLGACEDSVWCPQASEKRLWVFKDWWCWLAEEGSDSQRLEQTLVLILSSLCPELTLVVSWAKRMGRRLQQSCSCITSTWRLLVEPQEYGI